MILASVFTSCTTKDLVLPNTYTLDNSVSQYGFGFSIDYQEDWSLQKTYPQEDYIKLLLKQESYVIHFIKLNAPNNAAGVQVGANYVRGDEGYTLSELEKDLEKNLLPEQTIVEQKRIMLNGHEASYTHAKGSSFTHTAGPAKGMIGIPQNIVIRMIEGDRIFILIYSATVSSPDDFEKHKSNALAIMNSFRFE